MLAIFICEDEQEQRKRLEKVIADYLFITVLDMEIVLSTTDPLDVLAYLETHPKTKGLYFLDVDLKHEMNGITLASHIRVLDDLGKIVFVTTHGELSYLTFTLKVEAMDYIIKDKPEDLSKRIQDCIDTAHQRHVNDRNPDKKVYTVKLADRVLTFPYEDIMFIDVSDTPHKLVLHLENGQLEYYGSLKQAVADNPEFYRCHKSVVVNPKNVKEVDKATKEAEMINGEFCYVSARAMKGLLKLIES